MSYPDYDSTATYEVADRVSHNGISYVRTLEGEDAAPGTAGSFWYDFASRDPEAVKAAEIQAALDLEQALTDAGFKPQYVCETLRILYH